MRLHLSLIIPLIVLLIIIFYPIRIRETPEYQFNIDKIVKYTPRKPQRNRLTHSISTPKPLDIKYLETKQDQSFQNPLKYDNGKISIEILPYGEMTEVAMALGFQINTTF